MTEYETLQDVDEFVGRWYEVMTVDGVVHDLDQQMYQTVRRSKIFNGQQVQAIRGGVAMNGDDELLAKMKSEPWPKRMQKYIDDRKAGAHS